MFQSMSTKVCLALLLALALLLSVVAQEKPLPVIPWLEKHEKDIDSLKSLQIPSEVLKNCMVEINGELILDMSADFWCRLGVNEQKQYAAAYQVWYARKHGLELEKVVNLNGVPLVMRLIPPGKFWMGSPENEIGRENDENRHQVAISKSYYIGKYEVTQLQLESAMGNNSSSFKDSNTPARGVSWNDCQNFCGKNSLKLPTEAQWEYACRAGVTYAYCGTSPDEYGWYKDNSKDMIHPVGQKSPNSWGLYDMHGNVFEWCLDWKRDYSSEEVSDPIVLSTASERVFRGGSFSLNAQSCRSGNRGGSEEGNQGNYLGFRVLLKLTEK